jgi:DNA-binding beta-propeller fold protein YncE
MKTLLALTLLACAALPAQQTPAPTELAANPFVIKDTWIIGGAGNWDYLTMDPQSSQLLIAHGPVVQVVDTETGTLAGQVTGLRFAHSIALDEGGDFGYVSDGPANQVAVFDRRAFKIVARIPTGPNPRALVYEPQTKLLFAVSSDPLAQGSSSSRPANQSAKSSLTVIDTQARAVIATILLPGKLGFAATNGAGQLFIILEDRNEIAWIDATAIESRLHGAPGNAEVARAASGQPTPARPPGAQVIIDWSSLPRSAQSTGNHIRFFPLGSQCPDPRSIAVDSAHMRIFAACNNLTMEVLNAANGDLITSLPIGYGVEAIGYDPDRGLIYTANGAAMGSLTVIHQDVTDTYAVIQTIPTRQRARTLAVNPVTGDVYLVTDYLGMALDKPGSIGTLHTPQAQGSFQILVISH